MYQNETKIYDIVNFGEQFSYVYGKKIAPFKCISISIKSTKTKLHCTICNKSTLIILKIFKLNALSDKDLFTPDISNENCRFSPLV